MMKVRLLKKNTWWGKSGWYEQPVYYVQVKVGFWWETKFWIVESHIKELNGDHMHWFKLQVSYLKRQYDEYRKREKEVGLFGTREVLFEEEV